MVVAEDAAASLDGASDHRNPQAVLASTKGERAVSFRAFQKWIW